MKDILVGRALLDEAPYFQVNQQRSKNMREHLL